jgi:hypothetical protein
VELPQTQRQRSRTEVLEGAGPIAALHVLVASEFDADRVITGATARVPASSHEQVLRRETLALLRATEWTHATCQSCRSN